MEYRVGQTCFGLMGAAPEGALRERNEYRIGLAWIRCFWGRRRQSEEDADFF